MRAKRHYAVWALLCAAGSLFAADGTWTAGTGGNWSDTANWQEATIAEGSGYVASFNTGSGTVTNDMTGLALLGIQIASGGYTLAGDTITLDDAGFITVLGDSHTVSAPLALSGGTTLAVASGQTLTLDGAVSGAGGLTLYGGRTVLSAANTYAGPTVLVTGILETASVDSLGSSSDDPANFVLGEGLFRYTGPSATLSRGFTVAPTNNGNRATIMEVTDADSTLTLAGKVIAPNGSFIKTGEGTLVYTFPGYQELNKSRSGGTEAADLVIDENGSAGTNGYSLFVVDKGRVVLGAPGQTNIIYASAWVGSRTLASPRMDITGGVTKVLTTYFTIGRGTGTKTSPQHPSLYVTDGAYAEFNRLVMGYYNGVANFYSEPYLHIDGATMVVQNDCFLSENASLVSTVTVTNGGLFQCDSLDPNRGMSLSQTAGAETYVNIGAASTGRTYQVRLGRGGNLNVTQNSVFELDTTPTNVVPSNLNLGTARFNSGTLAQRRPQIYSDWFVGATNVLAGAGDMTVDVGSHAWLDPVMKADPSSPGGQLIKTGAGSLSLRPTSLNVQVNAGSLAAAIDSPWITNGLTGTLDLGTEGSLRISGANALSGMTVGLGSAPLTFSAHNLCYKSASWSHAFWSKDRSDGYLQLTENMGNSGGASYLLQRYPLSAAWSASFLYRCQSTQSNPADGAAFVVHNDPRGTVAQGSLGGALGYGNPNGVTNSVAVCIDIYNKRIRFAKQGNFLQDHAFPGGIPNLAALSGPTAFTVSYDGAGVMTCLMTPPGYASYTFTYNVDLATELGDTDGYVGFTASTGGAYGQHIISDVEFEGAAGASGVPDYCRHGGRVALGAGETLAAVLEPSETQRGFVMGELAYADQSVIDVDASEIVNAIPSPTLADQGMWQLSDYANWKPDGRLAVSTNANSSPGEAYTTNRYPISRSWVARFVYDLGAHSSPPADFVTFSLQNSSPGNTGRPPNPGCSIMWRYYEGAIRTTQVKLYTNGVVYVATTNATPIDFVSGGLADVTVAWDEVTRDMTVTMVQAAGTNVTVISNVDVPTAVGANDAYVGFTAATGGLNAENIVGDFSFTTDAQGPKNGYLAFDRLAGSGTLVKRGSAALGLMGTAEHASSNVTLRLEEGGLVLRKTAAEPLNTLGARSDWVFSSEGKWAPDDTLQFCEYASNAKGTATSTRRVRVKEAWTASFKFSFGKRTTPPADAFSMFFHNDPRGPGCVGSQTSGAGYSGIANSIGLRWYFYPNNNTSLEDSTSIGRAGSWDEGSRLSHVPITLTNGVTDITVKYDPVAATLTSVMTQGATVITNTFTGVNMPADVGGDYAYLGFGGGCGGSYGEMRVSNLAFTYDAPQDGLADVPYLAELILPDALEQTVSLDTPVEDGVFRLSAATLGDGATLSVETISAQSGVLTVDAVALAGDAAFDIGTAATLALTDVDSGNSVTKAGAGALKLAGATAAYAGDTVLAAGTLSIDAARLPTQTDLHVTSGATLNLSFTGKQYIHSLFVDGVAMPGGQYTAAKVSWISGDGTLVVRDPPVGTALMLR